MISPLSRTSLSSVPECRHRGGLNRQKMGGSIWICAAGYPVGRGSNGVAGAHTVGIPGGTFPVCLRLMFADAEQRENYSALSSVTESRHSGGLIRQVRM